VLFRSDGFGPFVDGDRSDAANVLAAQGFLVPATLAMLFVGALREQRRHEFEAKLETERRLREIDREETLGTMATGVAHDLGNLAMAIRAYQTTLRSLMGETSEPISRAVDGIGEAAAEAQALTQSLMEFARTDEHEPPSRFDLCEVVLKCCESLEMLVANDCDLVARVPTEPIYLLGRSGELQRILTNLVMNARDALEPGCRHVEVKVLAIANGVCVKVIDEGRGMEPDAIRRACDPFFTTKPRGKGTGLGLAVVRGLVTDMGGSIEISSAPGVGTTVAITFPHATEDDESSPRHRGQAVSRS